jgi:hypothetical protein
MKKPTDAELMKKLRHSIFNLYLKVKGVKGSQDEAYYDEHNKIDIVSQMAFI